MQQQLLELQELLSSWYLLVLDNKLFVGALVLAVWIFVALIYAVKGFFVKKKHRVIELQSRDFQEQLESTNKKIKQLESNLNVAAEQMEEEQQASSEFMKQIAERNQSVVEKIRELAQSYDLSEQLVGASDDIKTEFIWQQQDNIIAQLAERLSVEKKALSELGAVHKKEIAKLAESESSTAVLKEGLDALTEQVAQFGKLSTAEQESKVDAYDKLETVLEKNQSEIVDLVKNLALKTDKLEHQTASVKQAKEIVSTSEEVAEVIKLDVDVKAPAPAPVMVEEPIIEPVKQVPPAVVISEEPVIHQVKPTLEEPLDVGMVAPSTPEPTPSVPEIPQRPAPSVSEDVVVPATPKKVEKTVKKVAKKSENKSEAGRFGKVMGLSKSIFSKKKSVQASQSKTVTAEPVPVVTPSTKESSASEALVEVKAESKKENFQLKSSDYSASKVDIKGKFKGLFSKKK